MKRNNGILENDDLLIYVGATIIVILSIVGGIMIYAFKNNAKIENEAGKITQEEVSVKDAEEVSEELGKTVEEQKKEIEETNENKENKNEVNEKINNKNEVKSINTNTNINKTQNKISKKEDKPSNNTIPENREETVEVKNEMTFVKPTEGEIISEFAKDNLIYSDTLKEWVTHTGIDIKADKTSVIKSAAPGIIKSIKNDPRYGLTVVIQHDDGYQTVYSNLLTAEFVVEGEEVDQGQTIGTAGNTAAFESNMDSHLHFEIIKDGEYLNPSIYLK